MGIDHDGLRFERSDTGVILARMSEAAVTRDGRRWMNMVPDVDPDDVPSSQGLLGAAFSGRGQAIPEGTWVPPATGRRGITPASLGIGHGQGRDALQFLAERGVVVPTGWTPRQDHPKRGIVIDLPETEGALEAVLGFLMRALEALSPVECDGRFIAVFARRR